MKKQILCVICGLSLGTILALSSCSGYAMQENTTAKAQQQNRNYMSQVHVIVEDISSDLQDFNDALGQDNEVKMQNALSSVNAHIEKLEAIEAPSVLDEIHTKYVEGTQALEDALESYVKYYSSEEKDASALETIQQTYSSGIDLLEEADNIAAGL
jgi:hypothetical protein